MPHFIIHCSENILTLKSEEEILRLIHDTADATELFKKGDVKVRVQSFKSYTVGNTKSDFIHVFGNIMEGRTIEQKADLSKRVITKLKSLFPDVPVVSMNVSEFEKATYCNRDMI
ncbi:MAG: 5-carboxymethyl-2-hydroxymuconate Delta-isomerase [Bacteroidota bacterium]